MYKVWVVFEKDQVRYYIVNIETRAIQSAWKSKLEAKAVCEKLNRGAA